MDGAQPPEKESKMRKTIPLLALMLVLGLTLVQVGCSKDEEDPVTPQAGCVSTVTTPVEGRSWFTGEQISVNWTKETGGNVMVELYKGADLAGTITHSTANSGFYPWLKSTTFGQPSGEDYSVKVTHLTTADCAGQSGRFELIDVSNCFIKFPWSDKDTIPDLKAGNDFEIVWLSEHTSGTVDLELWYEPFFQTGTLVGIIAQDLTDTGSYIWNVDSFHRGTDEGYRFKIRDVASQGCDDKSITFNILDEENCSIDVLGINAGTTYTPGENLTISFAFENSSGVVDLKLYSGNIPVTGGIITENFDTENGTTNFIWSVRDFGHTGPSHTSFNIRAWDANDGYCVGESSKFTIAQ